MIAINCHILTEVMRFKRQSTSCALFYFDVVMHHNCLINELEKCMVMSKEAKWDSNCQLDWDKDYLIALSTSPRS